MPLGIWAYNIPTTHHLMETPNASCFYAQLFCSQLYGGGDGGDDGDDDGGGDDGCLHSLLTLLR